MSKLYFKIPVKYIKTWNFEGYIIKQCNVVILERKNMT